jgi:hypothetical protein
VVVAMWNISSEMRNVPMYLKQVDTINVLLAFSSDKVIKSSLKKGGNSSFTKCGDSFIEVFG